MAGPRTGAELTPVLTWEEPPAVPPAATLETALATAVAAGALLRLAWGLRSCKSHQKMLLLTSLSTVASVALSWIIEPSNDEVGMIHVVAWSKKPAASPPAQAIRPETSTAAVAIVACVLLGLCLPRWLKLCWNALSPLVGKPGAMASLIFSADKDVECLYLKWHLPKDALDPSVVGTQLATFQADDTIPAHMLVCPPGNRINLVKSSVREKNASSSAREKKNVYAAWIQFLTYARQSGARSLRMKADMPECEVVLVAATTDSRMRRCRMGESLDLRNVLAVAVASAATHDLDIKYIECDPFIQIGSKAFVATDLQPGGARCRRRNADADPPPLARHPHQHAPDAQAASTARSLRPG
jgi:hypothetical protein